MAYVVARRNGRFEVRESLHTPKGPRAHSLAGFDVLTDEILVKAAQRAKRPFDVQAVLASSRRAGAPVARTNAKVPTAIGKVTGSSRSRFVEASQRMALSLEQTPTQRQTDPGTVLIDLLGFADAVTRSQPRREFEPLTFPVLAKLIEGRPVSAGSHRG
jgi:hypothetical protein